MPPPKKHAPVYLPQVVDTVEQTESDQVNRRRMVRVVLRNVNDADDLVFLTAALDLDQELDELATTSERQRLISEARARLELTVGPAVDDD